MRSSLSFSGREPTSPETRHRDSHGQRNGAPQAPESTPRADNISAQHGDSTPAGNPRESARRAGDLDTPHVDRAPASILSGLPTPPTPGQRHLNRPGGTSPHAVASRGVTAVRDSAASVEPHPRNAPLPGATGAGLTVPCATATRAPQGQILPEGGGGMQRRAGVGEPTNLSIRHHGAAAAAAGPSPSTQGERVLHPGSDPGLPVVSFTAPIPVLRAASVLVIVLRQVSGEPLVLVTEPEALPGTEAVAQASLGASPASAHREGAVSLAARWANDILPPGDYEPWLAAYLENSPFGGPLAVCVLPVFAEAGSAQRVLGALQAQLVLSAAEWNIWRQMRGARWAACTWKALSESALAEPCAVALTAIEALLTRPLRGAPGSPASGPQHGGGAGGGGGDSGSCERWSLLKRVHTHVQRTVRRMLAAEGGDLADYADRVGGQAFDAAPDAVRGADPDAVDAAWATERFSPVLSPPATTALPAVVPQRHTDWRPASPLDLLTPAAGAQLVSWIRENSADLQSMLGDVTAPRRKPKPLVLGQSDFVLEARGLVWDLRKAADGVIEPLDFTSLPKSELNVPLIRQLLRDTPDRELLDHLQRGVDFKADLPLQIVLLPHMSSLAPHAPLVEKEIVRLINCGWHEIFPDVPFLPLRLNPNGAVVRKLEQLRPRRVENASADGSRGGAPLVDSDGVTVISLNEAVGIHEAAEGGDPTPAGTLQGDTRKWPKETKPAVLDKVHDLAVLRFAARVFDEDLVGFVVDFKDYFNNFPVSSRCLWMNICHWRGILGIGGEDLGCFVSELRLGFGVSAASNVCQRFAHALAEIFRAAFDREESALLAGESNAERRRHLDGRSALGPGQCRLYELSIYTDDPFLACVGVDRLRRALKLWHRIMNAVGLTLAVPAKRQCGAELSWLGVEFLLTAGVHFVPDNKRVRALHQVLRIIGGEEDITFADYRAITSFLQYLKPLVLHLDNDVMYHVYGPYRRSASGLLPSAASVVIAGDAAIGSLRRWVSILQGACGAYFSAVRRRRPPASSAGRLPMFSDAAIEDGSESGLGGYCAGLTWHIPLLGVARRLPITVAEFVAVGVNLIVLDPFIGSARPAVFSDSLGAVMVLNSFSAHGELMQFTHSCILELPAYKRLADPASFFHCFGPANPCADAVSRNQTARLQRLCAQLGIVPVALDVPAEARQLLQRVCAFAEQHGLLTDGPGPRRHSTAVELGAASQAANGFGHRGSVGRQRPPLQAPPPAPASDELAQGPARRRPQWVAATAGTPPDTARAASGARRPCFLAAGSRPPTISAAGREKATGARRPRAPEAEAPRGVAQRGPHFVSPRPDPTSDGRDRKRTSTRPAQLASMRAQELAERLEADNSTLALRPRDPSALVSLCAAHVEAAQQAHAPSTLDKDATPWRRWEDYCSEMGTPPLRAGTSILGDPAGIEREAILQSGFLLYLATVVLPRSRSAPAAKPQSLFDNLLAVRRVHQRLLIDFRIQRGAASMLKAQVRAFVKANGPCALIPARKEPLDAPRLRAILSLPNGLRIAGRVLDWDSYFFKTFRALLCTGLAAAFRKAELCLPDDAPFALGMLSVASVSWVIAGQAVCAPSIEALRGLTLGDFCVLAPPICKNDPFGLHFGTKPIWLPVSRDKVNAARAVADMFAAGGRYPGEPTATPLFRADAEGTPLRHALVDRTFADLVRAAFPGSDASRWSMHSLRIGAACALLAARASHALIQALCRWRSAKSIDIYARLGPSDYGRYVEAIEQQAVDAVTAQRVGEVRLDYDDIVAALDGPHFTEAAFS